MKKLLLFAVLALALGACISKEESTWDTYRTWRDANNSWVEQLQKLKDDNGQPYYQTIIPDWNPGIFVLIHYFNDRAETEGNLSPLYSSTIDVRYQLHDKDGAPLDSSLAQTKFGPGVSRFKLNQTIQGWAAAMPQMRCGDTAEIIVPYNAGYGSTSINSMPPYTSLRFNVRLVDIPFYEID